MNDDLHFLKETFDEFGLSKWAAPILDNPNFSIWTGSAHPENHHYGDGELLKHTAEVVELCLTTTQCCFVQGIDLKVLSVAALWHDYGKLFDYEKREGVWCPAKHRRIIRHISRGTIEFEKIFAHLTDEKSIEFKEKVVHCILSHHGRREWGSSVAPLTKEAWILHLCDGLSARINDADKVDRVHHK